MKKIACILIIVLTGWAPLSYAESRSVTINVCATILPVFELTVASPAGGNIEFGAIQKKANESLMASADDVTLTAESNLGRPYQITQALMSPLANESGASVKEEDFWTEARNLHSGGIAQSRITVNTESKTLFTSDAQGSSDTIKASYQLRVKPEQEAGKYQTKLVYTIVTM